MVTEIKKIPEYAALVERFNEGEYFTKTTAKKTNASEYVQKLMINFNSHIASREIKKKKY